MKYGIWAIAIAIILSAAFGLPAMKEDRIADIPQEVRYLAEGLLDNPIEQILARKFIVTDASSDRKAFRVTAYSFFGIPYAEMSVYPSGASVMWRSFGLGSWQTYTNEKYGFSFRYPSTYYTQSESVDSDPSGPPLILDGTVLLSLNPNDLVPQEGCKGQYLIGPIERGTYDEYVTMFEGKEYFSSEFVSVTTKQVVVGEHDAMYIEGTYRGDLDYGGPPNGMFSRYIVKVPGQKWVLRADHCSFDEVGSKGELETILKTLSFRQ